MKEFKVNIPEEHYKVIEFKQENLPGIGVVNTAFKDFEPKEVFAWHCSMMINFEELIQNGMPSQGERDIVDKFQDFLDEKIKGDSQKPNALFLARVTWNKTREIIWRIHNPEITNGFLTALIESEDYPREFDFRIDHDPEWKMTEWHLK
tara:strand:+ start:489 stop:935 length:447 start_codon:yes stop_codon:yes gene_type:complete